MYVRNPKNLFDLACDKFCKQFDDEEKADIFLESMECNYFLREKILMYINPAKNVDLFFDAALKRHWESTRVFFSIALKCGEKRDYFMSSFYSADRLEHIAYCVKYIPDLFVNMEIAESEIKRTISCILPVMYKACICVNDAFLKDTCPTHPF
jgi:hypothetical protein